MPTPATDPASNDRLPSWDLSHLYPSKDDAAVTADLARTKTEALAFAEKYKGKVASLSAEELAEAIRSYEATAQTLGRLGTYSGLLYSMDMTAPGVAAFYGGINEKNTAAGTETLFFTLEINRMDGADLAAKIAACPALAHYEPWLKIVRAYAPYQLSDEIEQLLMEKSVTGAAAWNRLFDETTAALRFAVDGAELSLEEALHKLEEPDRALRERAAHALADGFKRQIPTSALVLNTLVKDKEIEDRWRKMPDATTERHLSNQVEPEVVDALVTAVRSAYPQLSHRFYKLKAKWLGLETLSYWDRNAPLPENDDRRIPWGEAADIVLSAYQRFSPELAKIGRRFFEEGWIDAEIRPGKSHGAFAHPAVPDVHPYILVNYLGKTRDVMTLAHELGHGVHQMLAREQGYFRSNTPLTLAETASVFGEMLTFKSLLATAPSKAARKAMLTAKVQDMINTVVRQIAFYTFEKKIHAARREGELTPEQIAAIWLEVQSESLGPAITLNPGYETYWCYISHFVHSPFYVYAYAFGDCLVNALYAVYEDAHDGFAQRYLSLLQAGGSKGHKELLAPFGLDATDPAFWSKGLKVVAGFIDELEAMD